jgi:hypothetical protein
VLCQLQRSPGIHARLLPHLPRTAPLRLALAPMAVLGAALTAKEPSWNGTAFADPETAWRVLPPAGLPQPARPVSVAVTRKAIGAEGFSSLPLQCAPLPDRALGER